MSFSKGSMLSEAICNADLEPNTTAMGTGSNSEEGSGGTRESPIMAVLDPAGRLDAEPNRRLMHEDSSQ